MNSSNGAGPTRQPGEGERAFSMRKAQFESKLLEQRKNATDAKVQRAPDDHIKRFLRCFDG